LNRVHLAIGTEAELQAVEYAFMTVVCVWFMLTHRSRIHAASMCSVRWDFGKLAGAIHSFTRSSKDGLAEL